MVHTSSSFTVRELSRFKRWPADLADPCPLEAEIVNGVLLGLSNRPGVTEIRSERPYNRKSAYHRCLWVLLCSYAFW